MRVLRTLGPRRFADRWSFSGHGRQLYQYTKTDVRSGLEVADGTPREGAPVAPGEPRG